MYSVTILLSQDFVLENGRLRPRISAPLLSSQVTQLHQADKVSLASELWAVIKTEQRQNSLTPALVPKRSLSILSLWFLLPLATKTEENSGPFELFSSFILLVIEVQHNWPIVSLLFKLTRLFSFSCYQNYSQSRWLCSYLYSLKKEFNHRHYRLLFLLIMCWSILPTKLLLKSEPYTLSIFPIPTPPTLLHNYHITWLLCIKGWIMGFTHYSLGFGFLVDSQGRWCSHIQRVDNSACLLGSLSKLPQMCRILKMCSNEIGRWEGRK